MKFIIYSFVCCSVVAMTPVAFSGEEVVAEVVVSVQEPTKVTAKAPCNDCASNCDSGACLVRRRTGLFNTVSVYESTDGCCTERCRVVTPRTRCVTSCSPCVVAATSCETACATRSVVRRRVRGRRVYSSCCR